MEFALAHYRLHGNAEQLLSMRSPSSFNDDRHTNRFQSPASALKILNKLHSLSSTVLKVPRRCDICRASTFQDVSELADINWDDIAFSPIPTDFMYAAKSLENGAFMTGELQRFGPIHLSPSSGVLNYGQGVFEGMKAYRKVDGSILLFRPEENALRMRMGAERMCMPAPTVEHFVDAVKQTVLANKRWVPPPGKGSLYIRPMLLGTGPVLGVAPALEYTFLIFVSPVGNYFKEGLAPLNLIIDTETHRAIPGGTGGVKAIGNYSPVLKAQSTAKAKGYSDVLYLDSIHKKYIEEVSSCNIFVVKVNRTSQVDYLLLGWSACHYVAETEEDNIISTPAVSGTILPGVTRKSIIEVARGAGFQVEERPISVEELLDADEVFCTGTAVVVSPVGSITYLENRTEYQNEGVGNVYQQLYSALTSLQMGLTEDNMGWTVALE